MNFCYILNSLRVKTMSNIYCVHMHGIKKHLNAVLNTIIHSVHCKYVYAYLDMYKHIILTIYNINTLCCRRTYMYRIN